jgi:hypothetical protein
MPPTVLLREPGEYRLVAGAGPIDSARFAALAAEAGELLAAGQADRALRCAEEGAALWRGRPYGAAADKQWARAAVARLEEIHGRCARRTSVLCSGRAPSTVHWRSWRSHSPRNHCGSGSGPTGWPPTGTAAGRLRGADPHLLRSTASRCSSYISLPRRS